MGKDADVEREEAGEGDQEEGEVAEEEIATAEGPRLMAGTCAAVP